MPDNNIWFGQPDNGACGDIEINDAVGANNGAVTNGDVPDDNSASIDDDVIGNLWHTRRPGIAPSDRDILIERDVIADHAFTADDDTYRMRKVQVRAEDSVRRDIAPLAADIMPPQKS